MILSVDKRAEYGGNVMGIFRTYQDYEVGFDLSSLNAKDKITWANLLSGTSNGGISYLTSSKSTPAFVAICASGDVWNLHLGHCGFC